MLYFESDYNQGAHEAILRRFAETNYEHLVSYGADKYSISAAERIKKACECPEAEVRFLCGGTQTNEIVIDSMLHISEAVISAKTGHIYVHEAGAVEYTGHKILELPQHEGKIDAAELKQYLVDFYNDANREHLAQPGMVYISHPTEYGTLYSKGELTALSTVCKEYSIPLFMDGARLGYGLASRTTDLTLPDIASLCDVFYIGGTKVGALCGEAVVFTKNNLPKNFLTVVKQHGALLAKGRVLGVQFDTLFTDDLYFKLGKNAIDKAERLKSIFAKKGYRFFIDSPTNQQFIVLENSKMQELEKKVTFSFWEKYDDGHTVVRFATSWATSDQDLDELEKLV